MHQLYPTLLRMPNALRAERRGEEYAILVFAYACKDELKQVVEDGMLIRNRNFDQSVELVCLQLICSVIVLFMSYRLILIRSFVGHYDYPEYDLLASRVPVSAEGCGEVTTLCSIDRFLPQGALCKERCCSPQSFDSPHGCRCGEECQGESGVRVGLGPKCPGGFRGG